MCKVLGLISNSTDLGFYRITQQTLNNHRKMNKKGLLKLADHTTKRVSYRTLYDLIKNKLHFRLVTVKVLALSSDLGEPSFSSSDGWILKVVIKSLSLAL